MLKPTWMLYVVSKWKLAEKVLSCRDRNGITADQQDLNRTKGQWNNNDSSHSRCSKWLSSRVKRLSDRIGGTEERNLVPTIPVKIVLDAATIGNSKVGSLATSFAPGFEDGYCFWSLPLCLLQHALRNSAVADVILGDWWGKPCLLLQAKIFSVVKVRVGEMSLGI